jgi:hypothetical protein
MFIKLIGSDGVCTPRTASPPGRSQTHASLTAGDELFAGLCPHHTSMNHQVSPWARCSYLHAPVCFL